ncbi:orf29 [Trichoplusia ni single nucleopolyhedrovirus]|uniref:Orf29 n=1 Tax=Trichoplusia ni single nucleopolyhedrovirus TaxID=332054 RepID=Q462D6_9ABAC|nr:orf29 [Trichoplusia ni single nucleopolyhedrovirus]AAZ67400.1 orf29 [Trichoplusia ni single nucleopolyhedrovirus]
MYSKFLCFIHLSGLHEQAYYFQNFNPELQILNLDCIRQLCSKIRLVLHDKYDDSDNYDYINTDLIVKCLNSTVYTNPYVRGVQMAVHYVFDEFIDSSNENGKNGSEDDDDSDNQNRKLIQNFFIDNHKNIAAINTFFELNNIDISHNDYRQAFELIFTDYQTLLNICDDLQKK